ncbi:MAG: AAA family ATPase [Anaerolineae bacterium]
MESFYIPIDRRHALASGTDLPDRAQGAALFADISGFTSLTAALADELGSRRGAEELTNHLNRVYGRLIAQVHQYGGAVLNFSGDAITCWFDETSPGAEAAGFSQRAAAAALAMQQIMAEMEQVTTPAGQAIPLAIKVAVTTGQARRFLAGDPAIQRIEVLAGSILDRVAAAEQLAVQGEVIIGAEVAASLGETAVIRHHRAHPGRESFAVLAQLTQTPPPAPWPPVPDLPPGVSRQWLLPTVYEWLQQGQEAFLSELRPAVPLFLKFSGIDYDREEDAGEKLDAYIRWVQSILARYEASLLQLTFGDKGSYLYATFGAPIAHEDDPARAIVAALELRQPPPEFDFISDVQIGLSQGRLHAGASGGPTRRTYGVLGNEVNVAARLMSAAQPGQILLPARVAALADTGFEFTQLAPILLKGLPSPLSYTAVQGKKAAPVRHLLTEPGTLVGRMTEQALLLQALHDLQEGRSQVVIIEGSAGIGKSRLVMALRQQADALGVRHLIGAGDAIEQSTAYHAWQPIARQLWQLDTPADLVAEEARGGWRQQITGQLAAIDPDLARLAPLLNPILALNFPENNLTAAMSGEVRADNTQRLLTAVLRHAAAHAPLLLILEDAHWLDSTSWSLMRQVSRSVAPLLLVIATRPIPDPQPEAFIELRQEEETRFLSLDMLTEADTEALVRHRLGVEKVPPPLLDLIYQKAEGHPFFSEELAYALRDTGLIQIENGECRLAVNVADLRSIDFPDTVQGVITNRIDHLSAQQQLVVKVASVIGRTFSFQVLYDVYPVESDKAHIHVCLAVLKNLDITPLEAPEPDLVYIFKHIITQEVAYNLLTFGQRQQLHRAVAEWYEQTHAPDLASCYPILAHHWMQAEVPEKAITYLELAGEQATRSYANREAIRFYGDALRLERMLAADVGFPSRPSLVTEEQLRRAVWRRNLGWAYMNLGQLNEAPANLQESLRLLGLLWPESQAALVGQILYQTTRQIAHRLRPNRLFGGSPHLRRIKLESARVYELLGGFYAVTNEFPRALHALLSGFNHAETAGPTPELARAYANMANVVGTIPLHRLARRYADLAEQTAVAVNDLPTTANVSARICIYLASTGAWARIESLLARSLAIADQLGDRRQWQETASIANAVAFIRGQFAEGVQLGVKTAVLAQQQEDPLFEAWGTGSQARGLVRLGQYQAAAAAANQSLAVLQAGKLNDPAVAITNYGVLGVVHARLGDAAAAREAAEEALSLLRAHFSTILGGVVAHVFTAEAFLELLERPGMAGDKALVQGAKDACRFIFKRVRSFPIGEAPAWLCQGRLAWLLGRPAKAVKSWRKCLALAERYGMPYEAGMAHFYLGQHLPAGNGERPSHRARAIEILSELGLRTILNGDRETGD